MKISTRNTYSVQWRYFQGMDVLAGHLNGSRRPQFGELSRVQFVLPRTLNADLLNARTLCSLPLCLILESHFDICPDRHLRVDRIYIVLQIRTQTGEAIADMGESVCACEMSLLVRRLGIRQFCLHGSFSISGLYSVRGVGNSAKMPSERMSKRTAVLIPSISVYRYIISDLIFTGCREFHVKSLY